MTIISRMPISFYYYEIISCMIKPVGELSHLNCCTLGDIQNFYLNKPDHHITDLGGKSLKVGEFVQRRHSKIPDQAFSTHYSSTYSSKRLVLVISKRQAIT